MSITGAYTWEEISRLGTEAYFQRIYNVERHRITGQRTDRAGSLTRRDLCRKRRKAAGCTTSTCG